MSRSDSTHTSLTSIGLLIVAMSFLQCGAAYAKNLFPLVGPEGATTLRLIWAAALLGIVWRPWRHRFTGVEFRAILVYGLSLGGMNLLIYQALERIPLGIAVALEFTGPLAVAVLGSRRLLDLAWVALAALGIVLLLPMTAVGKPLDPYGVLLSLAAGLCWGLYIIYGKRVAGTVHGGVVTAWGMTVGMLLALPFGIARAGMGLLNWKAIQIAAVVSLLSSVIPYSLEIKALKNMPTRTFGILMALEPVIASVFGAIMLRESLLPLQWLAMACIIAASIGSTATSTPGAPRAGAEAEDDPEPQLPM